MTPLRSTRRLVLAGLLAALGLLLPFVTAHGFGLPGNVLLPMHIPVLLMGLLCGPIYGLLGGLVVPLLSSLLTAMPPVYPMLPIMMGELATYGLVTGLLRQQKKLGLYPSLLIAMACGRVVYGLIFSVLLFQSGGQLRALSVSGAFVMGLPGIAIQLILVPAVVAGLERYVLGTGAALQRGEDPLLTQALALIQSGKATCVLIRDGAILYQDFGPGVRPLLQLLDTNPHLLQGSFLVDKLIGKAAAMLAVLGGVSQVYGVVMSASGDDFLTHCSLPHAYGQRIAVVSNRTGDGICPLERAVWDVDDPQAAYPLLQDTVRTLMGAS